MKELGEEKKRAVPLMFPVTETRTPFLITEVSGVVSSLAAQCPQRLQNL